MASKQPTKKAESTPKLALNVPEVRTFTALLIDGETTSFIRLAKGTGSNDTYHPKRSVQKYLDALELMALARVETDGVVLLPSGRRFRDNEARARIAVRNAFVSAPEPKRVLSALSQTSTMSRDQAESRLRAIDHAGEADLWLKWLEFAGFVGVNGNDIKMEQAIMDPRTLYSPEELKRLREQNYRRLAMINDASISVSGNCFHRPIVDLLTDFRSAKPEDAEAPMMRFVEGALFRIGFDVQVANGPRDSGDKLHFGSKGEDVVAFFLHPPAAASDDFNGLVLSIELKRTNSDKKAVTQALAAKGRAEKYFVPQVAAFAVTISDSETYADKVAFDYAEANNVPHISIDTLMALSEEQQRRYAKPIANLITPVDIWHVMNEYRNKRYVEPRTTDVVADVKASADR